MGILSRAVRNISRRKVRALLVIVALSFSMAILVSVPAGISATQASTERMTQALTNTITQTSSTLNLTMTQIDCSLTPELEGFGFGDFTPDDFGGGNMEPPSGTFAPGGEIGGGPMQGQFGAGAYSSRGSTPMNETIYEDISSIDGVAAVVPILDVNQGYNETVSSQFGEFTRMQTEYIIEGIPLISDLVDGYPILPTNITAGRNLQVGDSGVVVLSQNNSAYFNVGVGDTVNILGYDFLVVGIHGSTGVEDRQMLYMNLSDAQAITDNTDMITSLEVFAENTDVVSSVSDAITALHAELNVQTAQDRLDQIQQAQSLSEQQLENAQSTLNQTQSMAFTEIVVAVVATSLIVLFVMLYTVRERTKEIGTLKAIGFSSGNIMGQFMIEGVLLSLIAGVIGVVIGSVAAPSLVSLLQLTPVASSFTVGRGTGGGGGFMTADVGTSVVTITPELMLIAFGASILLGVVGSLYPAWRAARTRPAEAMRYE